ncbi:hypothetical protein [Rossellomorea aquimaris]|nr:hypothetical protein [Rossellomorea aquimaris]
MDGAAERYSFIAEERFRRRGGGVKMDWMTAEEKQFVNEVLAALKEYGVRSKEREKVKFQIVEHIQESHEHGTDALEELGGAEGFVKDYVEINEIDVHSRIKKTHLTKKESGRSILPALLASAAAYFMSQILFSLFLTEAFNPLKLNDFEYNLLYRISGNSWWNSLLVLVSLGISVLAGVLIQTMNKRKMGA